MPLTPSAKLATFAARAAIPVEANAEVVQELLAEVIPKEAEAAPKPVAEAALEETQAVPEHQAGVAPEKTEVVLEPQAGVVPKEMEGAPVKASMAIAEAVPAKAETAPKRLCLPLRLPLRKLNCLRTPHRNKTNKSSFTFL